MFKEIPRTWVDCNMCKLYISNFGRCCTTRSRFIWGQVVTSAAAICIVIPACLTLTSHSTGETGMCITDRPVICIRIGVHRSQRTDRLSFTLIWIYSWMSFCSSKNMHIFFDLHFWAFLYGSSWLYAFGILTIKYGTYKNYSFMLHTADGTNSYLIQLLITF